MSVQESPVILSKYDPQGQHLAYVTIALDKQRIAVESTVDNGGINSENDIFFYLDDSNLRVTCMEWNYISSTETLCVFIGLNNGEIWVYSPLSNEVIYKLSTGNPYEIKDLDIYNSELWSIDNNDTIYQFSLDEFKLKQHFKIESCVQLNKVHVVPNKNNQLLVASHSISLIDTQKKEVVITYPGHITPVSILKSISDDFFISGAINDRFLNVYDINSGLTKTVLVSQSNVNTFSNSSQDVIAVTTEDGKIEIFEDPLVTNTNKKRGNKSKRSSKTIDAISEQSNKIAVININIKNDILNLTWLRNATIPSFSTIQWRTLPSEYTYEINLGIGTSSGSKSNSLYGVDLASAKNYAEGNAQVTSGDNFKHVANIISQLEKEAEEKAKEDGEAATETLADKVSALSVSRLSGKKARDSKGSGMTTGTFTVVLSQALQANDHSLLETVLNNRDAKVIKDTIIRLKPTLAVILLERLAERIARQTHRQEALNVWVKWCLIVHGGYLVTVPNLMSTLSSLHSTLKKRSDLLPRLLTLECKLEAALSTMETKKAGTIEEARLDDVATLVDEDEEFVEYNEELDDAGLIEDGEEDYDSESDIDEDVEYDERGHSGSKSNHIDHDHSDSEEEEEEEEGYSDIEM
ncbi:hypothetical protein Kpol_345p7 [Vanderwaltozyma polyspora DSM 70294]|uniref:Small-subunit processome Utp12 domain-containing protein n=1 Tax=Vanderwaltozyma polyspora (strain ATCC 22028 / DSM 70294 / BCRC 21397 / CBS 2163 / NBRC 10782 / NRRL Y-8283 / UCD 57-17) TaxID=436907 RepID=A7TSA2_VANPO|nr:uncharacterized protein Kpol_345p7 [Vanderwaltozyma polyspora DSM 70294]EDO14859.1 hypothetical protein Kpol_345p7 [Vanderwaltozyma polyspora DSM 70294]